MRYYYGPPLLLAGVTALALAACGRAETPPLPEAAASTDVAAPAETAGATPPQHVRAVHAPHLPG
jgi:hypothetical protein